MPDWDKSLTGYAENAAGAKAGEKSWTQEMLEEQKLGSGMGKSLLANNVPKDAALEAIDEVAGLKEQHRKNPERAQLEIEDAVEKVLNTHNEGMANRAKNTQTAQMIAKVEMMPPKPSQGSGLKP